MLWRGHFNATGNEKSVNLSINGGEGEKLGISHNVAGIDFRCSLQHLPLACGLMMFSSIRPLESKQDTSYLRFPRMLSGICRFSSSNDANTIEETDEKFTFPPGSLLVGRDNVITIVQVSYLPLWMYFIEHLFQDNMGLNETNGGELVCALLSKCTAHAFCYYSRSGLL